MLKENIPNNKTDISIVIINYNLAKEIDDCLNSFFEAVKDNISLSYEIIIVDNNSPDKDLHDVEKKFINDTIHFYYLEKNVGFGKGCNFGFSKAKGKYICFLNPDTLVKEDIFKPILLLFENDKSIGIIGPKQQVQSNRFDFSAGFYPNILFELFNLFGVGVFFEGFLMSSITRWRQNKRIEVGWILGAAIFIRAELFKQINGFDKDYFMFFEEVDLCRRVTRQGYKVLYCPEFAIHHIGSVSGKKDYTLYTIRTYSSKNIYFSKHYKGLEKFLIKSLLYAQLVSQIIIWSVLFPVNKNKSKQKLTAFIHLLKNKMKYEHRY
ncbi:MAG: glycosyltransferase family 2 protein [Ignavibacteriales bacterium]|nr:MAG: glycosyltransferase family 2 protein [Ignavibacteriales bacterium]